MSERIGNLRKIVVIDCQSAGISGDMFLGALLDLGADPNEVIRAIRTLEELTGCKIDVIVRDVTRRGIRATKIDFQAKEWPELTGAMLISIIEKCMEKLRVTHKARKFALNTVKTLLGAEASLHGEIFNEEIHLHELGEVDTPAEIIGSAVALENLGLFDAKFYSTPVAIGGGTIEFSHGRFPTPAPATLKILQSRNLPVIGGPVEAELATPTGVSLLVNLVDDVIQFYPAMKILNVGYGAGTRDFKEVPNVLRIVLGEAFGQILAKDEIVVLETNLDDVAGEVIGYVLDKLLSEGARDVSVIPVFMKKGRPGNILKVIADRENIERLARIIIEETGSLGVRIYSCERRILLREIKPIEAVIDGVKVNVRVKVSKDVRGSIIQIKPEYDDVREIAERTGKPLRYVSKIIEDEARRLILKEE